MNVTIIADASFCSETYASGYAFYIKSQKVRIMRGAEFKVKLQTSIQCEMAAIVNATAYAHKKGIVELTDSILIQSDCKPAMIALQGKCVVEGISLDIVNAFNLFYRLYQPKFRHVKGHSSSTGARYYVNKQCDMLAKTYMRQKRVRLQNE